MEDCDVMSNKGYFQLPINLQKFCAIRVVAMLWDRQDIKKEMEDIVESASRLQKNERYEIKFKCPLQDKQWWQVTEKVLNEVQLIILPASVFNLLPELVIFMGKQIYHMYMGMIADDIKFNCKLFKKLFFTCNGLIDKSNIYQEWKKDPSFPDFNDNTCKSVMIANSFACIYRDFNFIHQNSFAFLVKAIQMHLGFNISITNWNRAIAVLLIWRMTDGDERTFNAMYSNLLVNKKYPDGEDKLFCYCIGNGYEKAAEYFYQKLDEVDKELMILPAAYDCIKRFKEKTESNKMKVSEEYLEQTAGIILFLMQKMSIEDKKKFLTEKIENIFGVFIKTWPYQKLCVEIVDFVWDDLQESAQSSLLSQCFEELYNFSSLHHNNIFKRNHQEILKFLMEKTPGNLKVTVFNKYNRYGLFQLLKKSDFLSLKMIINDSAEHRELLIDVTDDLRGYIADENDFELVRMKIITYMEVLQFSKSEKIKFMKALNTLDLFRFSVHNGHFTKLNKISKWLFDYDEGETNAKMNQVRGTLDPGSRYSEFLENSNYSEAESYLQWQFSGRNDELENFKRLTLTNEYMCHKFWFIWSKTFFNNNFQTYEAKIECSKLLEHFFKNPDEIHAFKKEILNNNCLNFFCESFFKLRTFPVGEREINPRVPSRDFILAQSLRLREYTSKWIKMSHWQNFNAAFNGALDFCSASPDKISEIKQGVKENDWWLDLHANDLHALLIQNSITNWVGFEREERKSYIRKYLESKKGAVLCLKIFTYNLYFLCRTHPFNEAHCILCAWVKQCGEIDKIVEEIRKVENVSPYTVKFATEYLDSIIIL